MSEQTKPTSVVSTDSEYLDNIIGPVELVGLAPLVNPFYNHVSSQRLMMLSSHLVQTLVLTGAEHPMVFSGIEGKLGEYEHDTTARKSPIQIKAVIPRFSNLSGALSVRDTPYWTVIFRTDDESQCIDYFNLYTYTYRSDGYGYPNKLMNTNKLVAGNVLQPDEKLTTSPAHDGNKYMLGTNLNVCFMDIPHVTEDAFIISQSAAKKLGSYSYFTVSFKIAPNQIPLNLYGNFEEYKFMPDIGETVRDDGILCALRTPTPCSIIGDTSEESLVNIQHLHDSKIYAKPGAEVVDVNITVNRSVKTKLPDEILTQVAKYRDPINDYCLKVVRLYNQCVAENRPISDRFNALVTRCMENLILDKIRVPGLKENYSFKAYKRKEPVEFIYITVTYRYIDSIKRGFKLTNRCGGKGTVADIWPDEDMPVDEQGFRADFIKAGISVMNRMNPSQWYEQFITRGAELVRRRVSDMVTSDGSDSGYAKAFDYAVEFAHDCNYNWARLIREQHADIVDKKRFIDDVLRDGLSIWMPPGITNINSEWVIKMSNKWDIRKSYVTYRVTEPDGTKRTVKHRSKILIGKEYIYLLYKKPHLRCTNLGYINQYRSPVRASAQAKLGDPIPQTANRTGEDEIRNYLMSSGAETAAYILSLYANSYEGVMQLGSHLLFDKCPSQLQDVEMSLSDLIKSNVMIGVTSHILSTVGVKLIPDKEEVAALVSDGGATNALTDYDDSDDDKPSSRDE